MLISLAESHPSRCWQADYAYFRQHSRGQPDWVLHFFSFRELVVSDNDWCTPIDLVAHTPMGRM
jgi:hypothetical protein